MPDLAAWSRGMLLAAGVSWLLTASLAWFGKRWLPQPPSLPVSSASLPRSAGPTWLIAAMCLAAGLLGIVAGVAYLQLWPSWPPTSALDRFLLLAWPGIGLLAWLACASSKTLLAGQQRRTLAVWLTAWLFVRVLFHGSVYLQQHGLLLTTGLAALLTAIERATMIPSERRVEEGPKEGHWLLLGVIAGTIGSAGMLILFAGYLKGGIIGWIVAAAWLGVTLGYAGKLPPHVGQVLSRVALAGLLGLLLIGTYFGAVPRFVALLTACVPALSWLPELPSFRRATSAQRSLARLTLVLLILAGLLWWGKRSFDQKMGTLVINDRVLQVAL